MKVLYLLGTLMLIGAIVMFISSYKLFAALSLEKHMPFHRNSPVALHPSMRPYVVGSYLGLALFVVGGLGAIIMIIQTMTRRF